MRTWLITGSSRGIGLLLTQHLLQQGEAVVATARNPQSLIEQLGHHPNLLAVAMDVNHPQQIEAAVQSAIQRFGCIDILVNNAGFGLLGAVEEASADEIERLYRTNVFGLLAVTRAVLPHMRARRSGHIMNISSIGGMQAAAGWGVYCSTKFAVEGLSEALAQELSPLGIHVTVVEPGYFRTDFLDQRSLNISSNIIEDYQATSGAMRVTAKQLNHAQPGDPAKLADALWQLSQMSSIPVRLPLGSDTIQATQDKAEFLLQEAARLRSLAISTDFGVAE